MAQLIELACGRITTVDDADAALVQQYRWRVIQVSPDHAYVKRTSRKHGRTMNVYLHRAIMQAAPGAYVDHIDGNTLNNQRSNLRIVTNSQNNQNRRSARRDSTTGIRNVLPHGKRYRVEIRIDGLSKHIGVYDTIDAAEAAAIQARRTYMTHSPECNT